MNHPVTAELPLHLPIGRQGIAVVIAAVLFVGCGDEEPVEHTEAPGYSQLHDELFEPGCSASSCHGGDRGISGLNFDIGAESAYDQLMDGEPTNARARTLEMSLVDPGSVDDSFLMTKLTGSSDELNEEGFGAAMPMGDERIDDAGLDAVAEWIEAGAPLEGQPVDAGFVEREDVSDTYVDCDATDEEGMRDCFEPAPSGEPTERLYSPPLEVPAQTEVILCTYLDYRADEDMLIDAVRGQQMGGGHHIAIFLANSPSNDFEPGPCTDEEMTNFRFLAGAGGGGGQDTEMPDGSALRIEDGQQIVMQSHYINTADEPRTVMDAADLYLTDEAGVDAVVDSFAVISSDWEIPAETDDFSVQTECTVDEPMDIYMLLGHTHEYGILFEFELIRDGEDEPELLYHATDGPRLRDDPEIKMYDPPMELDEGDTFRMTCKWDNPHDRMVTWPEEMCIALMYYGPGRGWLTCSDDDEYPTEIGGGDAEGCADSQDAGNELGVGKFCTEGGDECIDNGDADMCLAGVDPSSNFCSFLGCDSDDDCGDDATCVDDQGPGSACVPDKCLD